MTSFVVEHRGRRHSARTVVIQRGGFVPASLNPSLDEALEAANRLFSKPKVAPQPTVRTVYNTSVSRGNRGLHGKRNK